MFYMATSSYYLCSIASNLNVVILLPPAHQIIKLPRATNTTGAIAAAATAATTTAV